MPSTIRISQFRHCSTEILALFVALVAALVFLGSERSWNFVVFWEIVAVATLSLFILLITLGEVVVWIGVILGSWGLWALAIVWLGSNMAQAYKHNKPITAALTIVSIAAALILGARLCYLAYAYSLHRGQPRPGCGLVALPYQGRVVGHVHNVVVEHWNPDHRPLLITIEGGWGTGKTAITDLIDDDLSKAGCAVVRFNAWQHQSALSPELELYREIAGNWEALSSGGWIVRPFFTVLIWSLVRSCKLSFSLGKVGAELNSDAIAPTLSWSLHLTRLAKELQKRKRRIVVILDEVDRCDYRGAQTLFTFLHRFLLVPGICVVLPYVEAQMSFKVLNPLFTELPDLSSTMLAVLWDRVWVANDPAVGVRQRLVDSILANPRGGSQLKDLLAGWHHFSPLSEQRRNEFLFREKVFAFHPIHIPPITGEDAAAIIKRSDQVRAALAGFNNAWGKEPPAEILEFVRILWDRRTKEDNLDVRFNSIRNLEGAITEFLSEFSLRAYPKNSPDA